MTYQQYVKDVGGAPKEIGASQLAINALQSSNLSSIAADAVTYVMDSSESQNQINLLIEESNKQLANAQAFTVWCNKDPEAIIKQAMLQIPQTMNTVYQWQRTLGLARKSNLSVSASIFQQRINNIMQKDHLNAWAKVLFDMPDSYLIDQASHFWNKAFAIGNVGDHDAYMLWINNFWTSNDYINYFREVYGYSKNEATWLSQIRNWQNGVPDPRTGWLMVQRGYWLKSDWVKLMTMGLGWTTTDANALFNTYNYEPSISDVMNLNNLIPLDPAWIAQVFQRSGMSAANQAIFLAGMNKSLILKEIRQIWSQILSVYAYGAYTAEELTTLLEGWQFPQAEINIKIAIAEIVKTKTVNTLMRDADIYLYRQGTITLGGVPSPFENGLYDRLIAQEIPADVANAITRNEAAKKGIDWELPA